jgi:hypothetical protein
MSIRTVAFFPEVFFRLQDEISFHPELQILLVKHEAAEWETKMAEIAAYCGIVLDGTYTQDDFEKIAAACIERLKLRASEEAKKYLGKRGH